MRKTVVIGATTNPFRYAFLAAERLTNHLEDFVPIGIKKGEVFGKEILDIRTHPEIENVDTVTLYLNARNQHNWEEYILSLRPKRIIFNPGAENPSLAEKAQSQGVEVENACTLVMLGNGLY